MCKGNDYRYGFNGQEKDNEIKGTGNSLDFGARIYDSRLGRWLSLDPLQAKYPSLSAYNFCNNNPVLFKDPDGRDAHVSIIRNPQGGGGTIVFSSTVFITGDEAACLVQTSQKAFDDWNSKGATTTDGKWNVQIQMTFKVATAQDLERLKNSSAEASGENILYSDLKSSGEGSRAHAGGRGWNYKGSIFTDDSKNNDRRDMTTGNMGHINEDDGGRVAIHESLHLFGLGDRYSDVTYQYQSGSNILRTGCMSKPHLGFESDIMSNGWNFSQKHADNLVKKALEVCNQKNGATEFDMARTVDTANLRNVGAVPSTMGSNQQYTNPQPAICGN
jgi:RHS repeat-associated protein